MVSDYPLTRENNKGRIINISERSRRTETPRHGLVIFCVVRGAEQPQRANSGFDARPRKNCVSRKRLYTDDLRETFTATYWSGLHQVSQ
jgi:hypothetical protein